MYTRLQTVWSLPRHSRQANKDHSPRCHRRPNGPGRLADKVVQPTTQSPEVVQPTYALHICCFYIYILSGVIALGLKSLLTIYSTIQNKTKREKKTQRTNPKSRNNDRTYLESIRMMPCNWSSSNDCNGLCCSAVSPYYGAH